jgi:predicted nuclease of predicted toxin-antitoxin system
MKFVADESVDFPIIEVLRENNFDVFSIAETTPSISDDEVLAIAVKKGIVLLTQDKDFGDLVFRDHHSHTGVVLIRLTGFPEENAPIVLEAISTHQAELIDAFTVIQERNTRIRKLK